MVGRNRPGEMGITRFLRNPGVAPAEMVQTAAAPTAKLVAGRHILAIQDTTSLRDDGDQQSLVLHPTIAIDAQDGALLGLVHAELLRRRGGSKAQRKARPFPQNESRPWPTATEPAGPPVADGAASASADR